MLTSIENNYLSPYDIKNKFIFNKLGKQLFKILDVKNLKLYEHCTNVNNIIRYLHSSSKYADKHIQVRILYPNNFVVNIYNLVDIASIDMKYRNIKIIYYETSNYIDCYREKYIRLYGIIYDDNKTKFFYYYKLENEHPKYLIFKDWEQFMKLGSSNFIKKSIFYDNNFEI